MLLIGSRTTDWYEKFDPDYLEEPMRATELIVERLQSHTHKRLRAPAMHSREKRLPATEIEKTVISKG
ncbi:hypothetical protein [Martelella sp. HB161492]|uniref:hypothetical protein n=1 Tax=Martelella sp. HB161492 TaxID=2720726 RepID=UPI0015917CA9|nr:hypothetical protein [Martelella sp. HB161492]